MQHDVWTAKQMAEFLNIHVKTLYEILRKQDVPGVARVGRSYRILKEPFLKAWIDGSLCR